MQSVATGSEPDSTNLATVSRFAVIGAYAVLGIALAWSRLAYLGHSFWTDEILMVNSYVRAGPRFILTGPSINHELMALLSWAESSVFGESEIGMRLLSAVPFVAGVVLVTAWLHVRVGALSGVLFLFLATVSPLLLDITRQARGYGIAFLAMSVVVLAALEALEKPRTSAVVVMCIGGVIGSWTTPQLAVAFVGTGAVLLLDRRTRVSAAAGLTVALAAIAAWYLPHAGAVEGAASIPDGVVIHFPWVVTAPIDQILLPALLWIDGTALVAGVVWLPLVLIVVVVAASSPLMRAWRSALALCSGAVATVVLLWAEAAYVIPRYLSFLLVPLFMVVATGSAAILARVAARPLLLRTAVCLVVIGVLAVRFATLAPDVVGLPREANRDAADVTRESLASTPVLAYMRNPQNLSFYLGRPVEELGPGSAATRVCDTLVPVYYVFQDFALESQTVPCLDRPGVVLHRFRQYARGTMYVWWVPGQA